MRTAGSFRMVVAASPGAHLNINSELELVKAAALYGDKVTLLSPVATMLLRAKNLDGMPQSRLLELLRRVRPHLSDEGDNTDFASGIDKMQALLRRRSRSANDAISRQLINQQLGPALGELSMVVRNIASQAGLDQLDKARASGLVQIESTDPGDEFDLLVECIVAARHAQSGEPRAAVSDNAVVDTYIEKLRRHLATGREYLLFDEATASLMDSAIRAGVWTPAKGPAGRSAQAMTGAGLMGRLPSFPDASMDEVLDIRTALSAPLIRFRAAMVTVSNGLKSKAWERDFADEVHDVWVESVSPAVAAIEGAVRDDRSLRTAASRCANSLSASLPGIGIFAAGAVGQTGAIQMIGGAAAGVAPLLKHWRDRYEDGQEVRMQPFYFLYALDQVV